MGYLICQKCGGYYKLQDGESPDDFQDCECGGKLDYYQTIPEHADFNHRYEFLKDENNPDYILNLYQTIHREEQEENNKQYEKNRDKFFSSNFIINSGFIILTFSVIPLFYGILYSWIFYLIAIISIFFSLAFLFRIDKHDKFRNTHFQKMFILAGAIYGLTTLNLLALFGNPEFIQDLLQTHGYVGWTASFLLLYLFSVGYSTYFCYIFLKNSRMKDKIDFLNPKNKQNLYFGYYHIVFTVFLSIIASIIAVLWLVFNH